MSLSGRIALQMARKIDMRRMIYCSQAAYDFSPDELVDLLALSRANNERVGLTGMLLYASQSFLQMLEGESDELHATYARIGTDERHRNLRLLMDADVPQRIFPDWSMGFEHLDEDDLARDLAGFTPATTYPLLNPDLVTNGGVAQTLLSLYARNKVR